MRNLKRALSLTLASVMLLGMMVVGTSAASFPDVTAEDNVEAIEVLAAVKVLQGYDDGQYHADTPVTRNQMATIICRMMGWRDGDFAGLNPFPDVPDWAANYVAACVANGIVNGRDDGRFHGDDTVTATEAASMMLRALGYTRMPVGADWARAVTQQASRINLFESLNVGAYTALTRGDVAQLSLNTLQATLVDVEDNTLNISGGTSDNPFNISGGQINYIVRTSSNTKVANAFDDTVESGNTSTTGTTGQTVELGEHVFNGELKKRTVNQTDDMGRPSVTWIYKNSTVGTYATAVEHTVYVPYASTPKTVAKMIEDIDKSYTIVAGGTNATTIVENGDTPRASTYTPAVGDRLEVFMDSANPGNVKTIAITHWRADKMTGDAATRVDGKDTLVRLPGVRGLSTFNSDNTTETVHGWQGLAEDDVVLVYQDADNNYWVEKAESFNGTLTAVESADNVYNTRNRATIEGQKYDISKADNYMNGKADVIQNFNKTEATWFLDKGGNIVWVSGNQSKDVAYVMAYGKTTPIYTGDADYYVKLLLSDGTVVSQITKENYSSAKNPDGSQSATIGTGRTGLEIGTVVEYTVSDNKYILSSISAPGTNAAGKYDASGYGTNPTVQKGNPNVTYAAGPNTFRANAETVFFIRNYDGRDAKDTFTTYTGYTNVPDVKTTDFDSTKGKMSAYIGSDGYADYVFIDTGKTYNQGSNDLFYVVDNKITEHSNKDGAYAWSVRGILCEGDDAVVDIMFDSNVSASAVSKDTLYTADSRNSDNEITATTKRADKDTAAAATKYVGGEGSGKSTSEVVVLGGVAYKYDGTTKFYRIDKDGKLTMIDATEIGEDANDIFVVVRDSGTASEAGYYFAKKVFLREVKDGVGQLPAGAGASSINSMISSEGGATVTNGVIDGSVTLGNNQTLNLSGTTSGSGTITANSGSTVNVNGNVTDATIVTEAGATVVLGGNTTDLPKITGKGTIEVTTTIDTEGSGNVGDLDNMVTKLGVTPATGTSGSAVNFTPGVQIKGNAELIDYSRDLTVNEIVAKWAGAGETASSTVSMQLFKIAAADITADTTTIKAYYTTKTTVPAASTTGEGWTALTFGYGSTEDKVISTADLGGGDLEIVVPVGDKVTAVMYVVDKDGAGANAATTYIFKAN